jgi:hypothetical protein
MLEERRRKPPLAMQRVTSFSRRSAYTTSGKEEAGASTDESVPRPQQVELLPRRTVSCQEAQPTPGCQITRPTSKTKALCEPGAQPRGAWGPYRYPPGHGGPWQWEISSCASCRSDSIKKNCEDALQQTQTGINDPGSYLAQTDTVSIRCLWLE